jgi:hypothetical protein
MASSRHGRTATIGAAAVILLVVVVAATVGVAVFASTMLAVRLAVGGALAAGAFLWISYDAALRDSRRETARERANTARTVNELVGEQKESARTIAALHQQLAEARTAAMAFDADDTPTIVHLTERRSGRRGRIVSSDEATG